MYAWFIRPTNADIPVGNSSASHPPAEMPALPAGPLSGHFVVVETIAASYVDLLDPDSGRVRWSLAHFLYRWSGTALRLPGRSDVNGRAVSIERTQSLRGGCCGSPPPD